MAEIDPLELRIDRFISHSPATGVLAAVDGGGVVQNLIAWDPATGDVAYSAPAGTGANTRIHRFDRPIESTSTALFTTMAGVLTTAAQPNVTSTGVLASPHFTSPQIDSGLLTFAGVSASEVALRRSGTTLDVRLANDSAYANLRALAGTFDGVITGAAGITITAGLSSFQALTATTVTASGLLTASGGILVTGGATFSAGVIRKQVADGLQIATIGGTTSDLTIYNPAGTLILLSVPTGTLTIVVPGLHRADGGVRINGSDGTFAAGTIRKQSADGFQIASITGSTNDFALYNPAGSGNPILQVPTGTKNLVLDGVFVVTGGQIGFPATQIQSNDVNTLDDYEEGTWTPTLADAVNCSALVVADATYTKIGRLVYVQMRGTMTVTTSALATNFSATVPFNQRVNAEFSLGLSRVGSAFGSCEDYTSADATRVALSWTAISGIVAGSAQSWIASLVYHAAT